MWAWKLAPPVRTWLESMKDRLSTCAFVVVSSATTPEKIVKMMEFYSGKKAAAYAGFIDKDFAVENRDIYSEKIRTLATTLRR